MNKMVEHLMIELTRSGKQIYLKAHPECTQQINSAILNKVSEFIPFKNWIKKLDEEIYQQDRKCVGLLGLDKDIKRKTSSERIKVDGVLVQSVDVFRAGKGDRIGFLKFVTEAYYEESGIKVPGIVFMRGGSVAMLLVIRVKSKENREEAGGCGGNGAAYVVLTSQPRIPVPSFNMLELPAGMVDGSKNFAGKIREEIEEELGIKIEEDESVVDLTELLLKNQRALSSTLPESNGYSEYEGLYPTSGGSDEFVRLFLYETSVEGEEEFRKLEGRVGGLIESGERIKMCLIRLEDAWKYGCCDLKLTSALFLYDLYKKGQLV